MPFLPSHTGNKPNQACRKELGQDLSESQGANSVVAKQVTVIGTQEEKQHNPVPDCNVVIVAKTIFRKICKSSKTEKKPEHIKHKHTEAQVYQLQKHHINGSQLVITMHDPAHPLSLPTNKIRSSEDGAKNA